MGEIVVRYDQKHDWWYLTRGRETFYDGDRYMRTWESEAEARSWARKWLLVEPVAEEGTS